MVERWLQVSLGIAGWYVTSFGTLLLNKYLLGYLRIQPNTLALIQMVSTAIYGAAKTIRFGALLRGGGLREVLPGFGGNCGNGCANGSKRVDDLEDPSPLNKGRQPNIAWRRGLTQMSCVGAMRFATVVLGLVSLKHVAASFTETIKASAPFFTVVIAYFMIGERTSPSVVLSLVPVAAGLVLTSCSELSFNMIGFSAAVSTNIIECVQNVFSKRLLARDYTASQLQFYTSLTALVLQAPIFLLQLLGVTGDSISSSGGHSLTITSAPWGDQAAANSTDGAAPVPADALWPEAPAEVTWGIVFLLWIDGVLYHLQSVVAYVVMSYLSPVTVSVVNTLKRALLIWISILVFHNKVTPFAGLGTVVCLSGALWYNFARQASSAPTSNGAMHKNGTKTNV
mmetsp:Transcript_61035/g.176763  ORF Transcript_61035/g.176763 Transcript_61035/m.176763 type:complete len:397 (+) Transcript_61035:65-1255(+)